MPTTDTLHLSLVRAPDDDASFSPGYQRELRQFYSLARAEGGRVGPITFTTDSAEGGDGLVDEFVIPFAPVGEPTLMAAARAWLKGRAGRQLRLTIGDTEVVANSASELYGLLNLTSAVTQRLEKPPTDHV